MPCEEAKGMTPSDGTAGVSDAQCTLEQTILGNQIVEDSVDTRHINGKRKIVHIFGPPNSGKTTLRKTLAEMHPDYPNFCIDDFRRRYGDGTINGEIRSQISFWGSMMSGGFFECSGAGRFTSQYITYFRYRRQFIIVMGTPSDVCISRIRKGKYDGIPFPFSGSDEEFIRNVAEYLSSKLFASICKGIPTLRLDTTQSITEQAEVVERFAGLRDDS